MEKFYAILVSIKKKVLYSIYFIFFHHILKFYIACSFAIKGIQTRAFGILEINSRYENCHLRHFMHAPCVQWV